MRLIPIGIATLAATLTAGGAHAGTWVIDPSHTNVQFAVKHMVISTVRGHLGKVSGTLNLNEQDVTGSTIEATIDANGIDTRDAKRDQHLREPDFLDTAKYPTITFKSKKIVKVANDRYTVLGDLTLRGVTKEVTLEVEGSPNPLKDPFGNNKIGGVAKTRLNRKDFGVNFSKVMDNGGLVVGNDVDVIIDVELVQQAVAVR
ncbi:YceI family protein [Candidatus Binatia bacterium]|nr:YceI family protein [Candidatus Binatia bacterium]